MSEELLDELDVNVLDVPNEPEEELAEVSTTPSTASASIQDGTSNT